VDLIPMRTARVIRLILLILPAIFLKFLKNPFQSAINKINKTKLNKEIDNVISSIQADSFKFNKETAQLQTELIYRRHPAGLKVDNPQSLTSIALKAVQPHQLSELSPGIVNRDIAREIFFKSCITTDQ